MKLIHLTAALALALIPSATSSALAGSSAEPAPPIVDGENDVPGDFNEDGRPDLLWQNTESRELSVWLMAGIKPVRPVLIQSSTAVLDLPAVGTDDFNGDDRTDVVFWDPAAGKLVFWFMDGVTGMGMEEVPLGLIGHRVVSILDFNHDGNPDILFQDYKTDGAITVVLFNGTTIIAKENIDLPSPEVDLAWQVAGSGDFDRDGDEDLVLVRPGAPNDSRRSGAVAIALMDGNVGTIVEVTLLTDRNWVIGAVGDFTGDGYPDIFFDNVVTNETAVWEMQGVKIAARILVTAGTVERRTWRMVGPR